MNNSEIWQSLLNSRKVPYGNIFSGRRTVNQRSVSCAQPCWQYLQHLLKLSVLFHPQVCSARNSAYVLTMPPWIRCVVFAPITMTTTELIALTETELNLLTVFVRLRDICVWLLILHLLHVICSVLLTDACKLLSCNAFSDFPEIPGNDFS